MTCKKLAGQQKLITNFKSLPMRVLLLSLLLSAVNFLSAQTTTKIYTGEWREAFSTTTCFTCTARLNFTNDSIVSGVFIWTYHAIDSSNSIMVKDYEGKKGLMALEYVSGTFDPVTSHFELGADSISDKHQVIAGSKYMLKSSVNGNAIYGTSTVDEADPGFLLLQLANMRKRDFEKLLSKAVQ